MAITPIHFARHAQCDENDQMFPVVVKNTFLDIDATKL
jgi:hypothetical protein